MYVERTIPLYRLTKLSDRIESLNKRALKRGLSPFSIFFGEAFQMAVKDKDGVTFNLDFIKVKVSGDLPMVPGYKFLGFRTTHDDLPFLIGNIPEKFRNIENPDCFHCKTKRNRNDYAVVEKDGETVTLGKSCFKACFETIHADDLLNKFSGFNIILDELDDDEEDGGYNRSSGVGAYCPTRFMSFVAKVVANDRWISSSYAEEACLVPTWFIAKDLYESSSSDSPSSEDVKKSYEVMEYFKGLPENSSAYLSNVKVRLMAGCITSSSLALVASAISVFDREQEKQRQASLPPAKESEYVGEVKKREDFDLTVLFVFHGENRFGANRTYIFSDADGNRFSWKTSGCLSSSYYKTEVCPEAGPRESLKDFTGSSGDKVTVKATVVRHDLYYGKNESIKTTHLSRLKLLSFLDDGLYISV